jgi:anti-sigma factor RsiW
MHAVNEHRFDETLISGYLDGELTQAEEQKVRLHLQDCAPCREQAEALARIREAAMSTDFPLPDDRQWDETPRGGLSAFLRNFGWTVMLLWVAGLAGFGIWQLVRSPENLGEKLLVFGLWLGFGLVFLSVLIDRLKTLKTDRYRRVEK